MSMPKGSKPLWNIIGGLVVATTVILVGVMLASGGKPKEEKEEVAAPSLPKYTAHDGISVLLRAYTTVTKVCESDNKYFVYFEPGHSEDWSGWYNFKEFTFKQLENGTWYHDDVEGSNFVHVVGFESKGLECETKTLE